MHEAVTVPLGHEPRPRPGWRGCRHDGEKAEHDRVARELEGARGEFQDFERRDIKV